MGSQVRAKELVRAMGTLGHEIHLASGWNPAKSGMGWPSEAVAATEALGVAKVHVLRSRVDDFLGWALKHSGHFRRNCRLDSWEFSPPVQRRWFRNLVRELQPDILLMNYSHSDSLVESTGFPRSKCVLETHDLVLHNKRMQSSLKAFLPKPPYLDSVPDPSILDLDWFKRQGFATHDDEASLCAKYRLCLSISHREADRIRSAGGNVRHLPMALPCGPEGNTWSDGALFTTGPNSFNVQGYLWFRIKVLPLILQRQPDFLLDLTGILSRRVHPAPGLRIQGLVANLSESFLRARFAICPTFGGTGQQVKIVEAMAHGLAVVCLSEPAVESPLIDGVNGFVCPDERSFAEACIRLWNDRELCARMGMEARATVGRELSAEKYASSLKSSLETAFPGL